MAPAGAAPTQVPTPGEAITIGGDVGCAITPSGTLKCWGDDSSGALGNDAPEVDSQTPVNVSGLTNVAGVTAGRFHVCAWTKAGAASCWGDNDSGQVSFPTTGDDQAVPYAVAGIPDPVVDMSAGSDHTCAATSQGAVYCWGENSNRQVTGVDNVDRAAPTLVSGITGVDQVSAGGTHTCARKSSGAVACWGDNSDGKTGVAQATDPVLTPTTVPGLTAQRIDAGPETTCAVTTSASVVCFGDDAGDALFPTNPSGNHLPTAVPGLASGVRDVELGLSHGCVLTTSATTKCWGDGSNGQLGNPTRVDNATPTVPTGLPSTVRAMTVGDYSGCALLSTGALHCWGRSSSDPLGLAYAPYSPTPMAIPGTTGTSSIQVGEANGCAITSGDLKCWGANIDGVVGDDTTIDRSGPTTVTGVTSAAEVEVAEDHACLVNNGGNARCWGDNFYGRLGIGTFSGQENSPVAVTGISNVADISAGGASTCAVTTSGAASCWGDNFYGQLGDGTLDERSVPTGVSGLGSGVAKISVGTRHACAVLTAGTIKCWGDGSRGQLGNNSNSDSLTPVTVSGIASGATQVQVGGDHTCAVVSGGIKCWGDGSYGQLGNGSTSDADTPVNVTGLTTGQAQVAVGESTTCARSTAGAVKCFGRGSAGALGNGLFADTSTPVTNISSGVVEVDASAGGLTFCARTTTGAGWCWGYMSDAQGGFDPGWTPKQVTGSFVQLPGLAYPHATLAALVNAQYTDMLATSPSTSVRNTWVSKLNANTASPGDIVAALRLDPGQASTVDSTTRLYFAYFLRIPDRGGLNFWIGRKRSGWTLRRISDEFAKSSEFQNTYGSLTNAQFVDLIYENLFNRDPDPSGGPYWISKLNNGSETRGGVMAQFSESSEYKNQMASEVTTSILYIQLLQRTPSIEEFDEAVERLDLAAVTTATLANELFTTATYVDRFT